MNRLAEFLIDFIQSFILWLLVAWKCSICGVVTTKPGIFCTLTKGKPINNHVCQRCFAEQRRRDISQRL